MAKDWENGGFGLYIHWPFCAAKCPYCDFNSHVSRQIDYKIWRDAYLKEIRRNSELTQGRVLRSVFFGGGTPSLMEPETVADVIAEIRASWPVANDLEITLEANPTSVEAGRFAAFRQGGVNRVSMGIQALNDPDLSRLGRMHTAREALDAFEIARSHFDRVSFDLIYARQDQSLKDWERELKQALSLAIDHLSLYQLTIEQGTAFGDRYNSGKLRGLPDDDTSADMYEMTQDICGSFGMRAYEVSNHARDSAESRHNLIYWRYGDYIGIGPGAHGRVTLDGKKYATETRLLPQDWLDDVASGTVDRTKTVLTREDQGSEFLLMGLRLKEGIDLERYGAVSGSSISETALTELLDLGMVSREANRLIVTDQGFCVLNAVIAKLLTA